MSSYRTVRRAPRLRYRLRRVYVACLVWGQWVAVSQSWMRAEDVRRDL